MLIRSIAPLRLGLAGGGTDVSPYSDLYGGAVLNATISMYAYATIEPRNDGKIEIVSIDRKESLLTDAKPYLEIDGKLDLIKGVYNRIVKDFNLRKALGFYNIYICRCSCWIRTGNIFYCGSYCHRSFYRITWATTWRV
jgi:D-glycero-alpha-D-manno-heptose-7-phosphate kinase